MQKWRCIMHKITFDNGIKLWYNILNCPIFVRRCLFLKAMISAIQTDEVYGEFQTPNFLNTRYSPQSNLRPKSYFANAKVFSGLTAKDLPPLRDKMHKIDD